MNVNAQRICVGRCRTLASKPDNVRTIANGSDSEMSDLSERKQIQEIKKERTEK